MFKYQVIENQEQLTCQKNHNSPITTVLFDDHLKNNERLLCNVCMQDFEGNVKIVGFQKVIQIIENEQKRNAESVEVFIKATEKNVQMLAINVQNLKTKMLSQLDQIEGVIQQWKNQLDQIQQSTIKYSFFEELDNQIKKKVSTSQSHVMLMKNIQTYNQSCQSKLESYIDQLMSLQLSNEYQEFKSYLKELEESSLTKFREQLKSQNFQQKNQNLEIQLIENQFLQPQQCRAISFNHSDEIMISTCDEIIRVFNFKNGIIEERCKLLGHSESVNCLIFSKFSNCFISGSADCSIRCWQQSENTQWKSSQPYNMHTGQILCIILNQKENELISASLDSTIKIWELNFKKNILEYQTQLIQHQDSIFSLSLNESETFLVSAGLQNRIIVWKKKRNVWVFSNFVKQSFCERCLKVKFLRDNLLLSVADADINVFELNNGVFQQKNDKAIELQRDHVQDSFLFPITQITDIYYWRDVRPEISNNKNYLVLIEQKLRYDDQ
ncbi:unnamed protein product (macronuclear) [Paramecium tetraurelia]|uniref:Uncharacterized protein n=1 Tax=Paramecium tetraurelia TaxID=5888 RepID=A0CCW1_PARTE|nr:uncharacterized protein GSPATT00037413001 [Paramecium tetraurelia]CAK68628.1 unnamed protein product [Paramecium tetraurelia]|eukprot:XP_001436025.1 hypothetical protein (macronuclear) [Paramecium tetraurelia strain d4-2]